MELPVLPTPTPFVVKPPPILFVFISLVVVNVIILFVLWGVLSSASELRIPIILGVTVISGLVLASLAARLPLKSYSIDDSGITFLGRNDSPTAHLAWQEITEVRSGKQEDLYLYDRGRTKSVKITRDYMNYELLPPILVERLYSLWRNLPKTRLDQSVAAYTLFLLAIVFVAVGVFGVFRQPIAGLMFMGIGGVFAYFQLQSVRRLEFTSDGLQLTKVYGRELVSADSITGIEFKRSTNRNKRVSYSVVVKRNNGGDIHLDGFSTNSIALYCILSVWWRDQIEGNAFA